MRRFSLILALLFALAAPPSHSQALPNAEHTLHKASAAVSNEPIQAQARSLFAQLPLRFERNQGQADSQVKFISRGSAYSLFLSPREALFALPSRKQPTSSGKSQPPQPMLHLRPVGANENAQVVGVEELPAMSNYFLGNDPKKWQTKIANFSRVKYQQIYPGVDLEYYGSEGGLEYDFVVAPHADPASIKFELVGESSLMVKKLVPVSALSSNSLRSARR